jgi:hypothetical protein
VGGIVVAFKPVLWSPVGAPAGVPGPRRNADDCDAGWFAPVATRRRPIFVAFQAPSPWLAVSPGGTILPGGRPPGAPRWGVSRGRPPLTARSPGGLPLRPGGPLGSPEPAGCRAPSRPESPSRFSLSLLRDPRHLQCLDNSVPSHTCATGCSGGRGRRRTRGLVACVRDGRRLPGRGVRPAPRPRSCWRLPCSRMRSGRWVSWARSSVRAQLTLRPPPSSATDFQPR